MSADNQPNPPVVDDSITVEAERMEETRYNFGRRPGDDFGPGAGPHLPFPKAPVLSSWICLAIAWFFFASQIPLTVVVAIPFDLAAVVLAAICISRGKLFSGGLVLVLATVGSLVVYLVSLAFFVGGIAAGR